MKKFADFVKANYQKLVTGAAAVLGVVSTVSAESDPLADIVSNSTTVTGGIVSNMGALATFVLGNDLLKIALGTMLAAMAAGALIRWVKSISLN